MTALEHRWYVFSGLEMALFVDAGKTVPQKGGVNFSGLNYSGGIGLRARVRGAVVLRMDVARSREGIRWIWSMSDISRRRFPARRARSSFPCRHGIGRAARGAPYPDDLRCANAAAAAPDPRRYNPSGSKPCRRRLVQRTQPAKKRRPRASTFLGEVLDGSCT